MLQEYLAPGRALEGLLRARDAGKVRYVGMSGHTDLTALAAGVQTGLVDVLLFSLNFARTEALYQLVPIGQQYDVGLTIMKPVSVGLAPAELALRWLAMQPIHTMVPGMYGDPPISPCEMPLAQKGSASASQSVQEGTLPPL